MNVQSIDLGDELREGIQSGLALAPVIFRSPVVREPLDRRELYSLGCICNRFSFRPLCRVDAPAQFGEFCFGNSSHLKRTNWLLAASLCSSALRHGVFSFSFGDLSLLGGCHARSMRESTAFG